MPRKQNKRRRIAVQVYLGMVDGDSRARYVRGLGKTLD